MNKMTYEIEQDAIDHADVISKHDRFSSFTLDNELWQLDHLNPFAFKAQINLADGGSVEVDVVVLFANHCFSRALEPGEVVDDAYIVWDGKQKRVLDKERHTLSRKYLPHLILQLQTRQILIADPTRPNFVTYEMPPAVAGGEPIRYAVFFELKKDSIRRKRMLLRVQSAYTLDRTNKRLLKADKIRFSTILKRAYS